MKSLHGLILILIGSVIFPVSCTKKVCDCKPPYEGSYKLTYGDSVLYLKNAAADQVIYPLITRMDGVYSAFPEGLKINEKTGAITVNKCETGLRYRITFTSAYGEKFSTMLVLSGINYTDQYYRSSMGDTIAYPVYNALPNQSYTGVFDYDGSAAAQGVIIDNATGAINLTATMHNGFLSYQNDVRKELEIKYKLNDQSNGAPNSIKILLYYYKTMNDVPGELKTTVDSHLAMLLHSSDASFVSNFSAKPRPPCVIIVGD